MHIACKLIAINYLFLLNLIQSFHDKAIAKEIDNTACSCLSPLQLEWRISSFTGKES